MLRPEDTEKDLSDALEMYVRRAGGECSSFRPIVAADARAALPHAPPTRQSIAGADLLLVDWGASGPRYKSDLTRILLARSFSIAGRNRPPRLPPEQLRQVYTAVRTAQDNAFDAIRPGARAADVDAAARSAIADAGFGAFFVHGLGHGIGLQVHEGPNIRASSTDVLQAGMVFTVEPGIYLPGQFGIRIEDDVRVTPDGCEVLSHLDREWPD
jgi:Xaa-Pro aminopeptidase